MSFPRKRTFDVPAVATGEVMLTAPSAAVDARDVHAGRGLQRVNLNFMRSFGLKHPTGASQTSD